MRVIANWHDDKDAQGKLIKDRIGMRVIECLGASYDPRKISLYRLDDGSQYGELIWLADHTVSQE